MDEILGSEINFKMFNQSDFDTAFKFSIYYIYNTFEAFSQKVIES